VRLIQATVPEDVRPAVEEALNEAGIDYFATHETGTEEYEQVVYLSLPEEDVEDVLDDLYSAGLSGDDHVVLIDTEVDIFGHTDDGDAGTSSSHARIAAAELQGKTEDLLPDSRTFVIMMVLSAVVATTGVLLDSAAVVVGSMVLAPLFGPAVGAAVGTVIDDSDLFWRGVVLQLLGVVLAVVAATIFATVMRVAYLVPASFAVTAAPQIVERLSPDLLSLVVALVAGAAGIISIATASGRALVGVMMAAALLPPAAVVGVGLAWFEPGIAVHSGILLTVNLLAINFAGLVTLWYMGYRPQSWIQIPETRRALVKRGGALFVAILVTSAFLWNVTYANAQRSQVADAIEGDVSDLLSENADYANVTLVDVRVVQERAALGQEPQEVVVTIGRPPEETHLTLHREIATTVEERVGEDIDVEIQVSLVART